MKRVAGSFLFAIYIGMASCNSAETTLGFMGDVMLGRTVGKFLRSKNDDSFAWSDLIPTLNQTDFNSANLETALTTSSDKVPKVFNFKSDPSNVRFLKSAHIKAVNLANNHSLDFGISGLRETLKTLQEAGIGYAGAGLNLEDAQKSLIITHKEISIAFIGATDNEPTWKAGLYTPGINYMPIDQESLDLLKKQISLLKKEVDIIIISVHWGGNWNIEPPQGFIHFAHGLIDAGADIIHGHSAHIPQGIEIYRDKLIIYSAGDFIDDYAIDPQLRNDKSFFFLVTLDKRGVKKVVLIPVIIDSMRTRKATDIEYQSMIEHMQELSKKLGTFLSPQGIWQRVHE